MEWLLALAAVVVGIPAAAWFAQDRLIFFPQPLANDVAFPPDVRPLEIAARDGTTLRGWIRVRSASPAPTILYFGGNAEEVSWTIAERRWPDGCNIVALNYRGYGGSGGAPGERAIVSDALEIHDAVVVRPEVARERVYAMGRSLGTGVAVQLAAARPLAGVVLASPYDSLVAVGRGHYPVLPIGLLLRHRFDAATPARAMATPMLTLVAGRDAIIPVERSRALFDAWAGPKTWRAIEGTDHNTLAVPDAFWTAIATFVRTAAP